MRRAPQAGVLTLLCFAAGCQSGEARNAGIARDVERQVVAAHSGFDMRRWARFYAREADGSVHGVYLFANEGYSPPEGRAGEVVWTTPDKLPIVEDGGCAVITVNYDPDHRTVTGFECNGEAMSAPLVDPRIVSGHR